MTGKLTSYSSGFFQQSLQDLIRSVRAHRRDETEYLAKKFAQVQQECKSTEPSEKAIAVLKLIYFQLQGYNVSSEAFHIIEAMSRQEWWMKRTGYLVASLTLSPSTDLLLLTTNLLKKDLSNVQSLNASLALSFLSCIVNEEIGRECKAIFVVFRVLLVYPEATTSVLPRLKERLEDSDTSVLCAAVTVFAELASRNPKLVVPYIPRLYHILQHSSNNWMSIKILKTLTALCQVESRLSKKLLPLIQNMLKNTKAKSLLYECCRTVAIGMLDQKEVVELCSERLSMFLSEKDPNLKYLSLFLMKKLESSFPVVIYRHKDIIFDCLDDSDDAIRRRALDLVRRLISKSNFKEIARILMRKLREESQWLGSRGFRDSLIHTLLDAGSYSFNGAEGFPNLSSSSDFHWYLYSILHGLVKIYTDERFSIAHMMKIAGQFVDIVVRVESCRKVAVNIALEWLWLSRGKKLVLDSNSNGLFQVVDVPSQSSSLATHGNGLLAEPLLFAACWILGEYSNWVEQPMLAWKGLLQDHLFRSHSSGYRLAIFASWKLFLQCWKRFETDTEFHDIVKEGMIFLQQVWSSMRTNPQPLVQERAHLFYYLLSQLWQIRDEKVTVLYDVAVTDLIQVFEKPLKPVDSTVQSKYQPFEWDKKWNESILDKEERNEMIAQGKDMLQHEKEWLQDNVSKQQIEKESQKDAHKPRLYSKDDPFYISSSRKKRRPKSHKEKAIEASFTDRSQGLMEEEDTLVLSSQPNDETVQVFMGLEKPPLENLKETSPYESANVQYETLSSKRGLEYIDISSLQEEVVPSSHLKAASSRSHRKKQTKKKKNKSRSKSKDAAEHNIQPTNEQAEESLIQW
ncbi:AP-3 complex subunit delta-1 [Galdieria sulphuraria]|nr:AP-3 complex subunit delta-1 [Galdieria sulphuraria]